jgi:DNA mismatch endonuclease, patch repair protein
MDKISQERRSQMMARVGRKNTKPEMQLRQALFALGLRYRLHAKRLPGTPDLVFPRKRIAIFVHGCFWHFHTSCKGGHIPKTNKKFWKDKLERNIARDARAQRALIELGWDVMVVWECELGPSSIEQICTRIADQVRNKVVT